MKRKKINILVTGGAGFIGSALVKKLVELKNIILLILINYHMQVI